MLLVHKVVHLARTVDVEGDSVALRCVVLTQRPCPEAILVGKIWTGVSRKIPCREFRRVVVRDPDSQGPTPFGDARYLHTDFLPQFDRLAAEGDPIAEVALAGSHRTSLGQHDGGTMGGVELEDVMHGATWAGQVGREGGEIPP